MDKDKFHALYFRISFQDGQPKLGIGHKLDHTAIIYELTWDQLRGLVLDAMPELLKR